MKRKIYLICLGIVVFLNFAYFLFRPRIVSQTREMMGRTLVRIQVLSWKVDQAQRAMDKAFLEMKKVEEVFSLWIPQSEVCQLNERAATGPVRVSFWMRDLIQTSLEISRQTQGAFDVTVMPLASLWKKGIEEGRTPTQGQIEELRPFVDFRKIRLKDEEIFFLQKGMKLDFGAIAKGYAVDQASRVLREHGLKNFIVEAGGDLYVSGRKSFGRWKIGVRHPRVEDEVLEVISIEDRGVATSGDYEQYLDQGGRRYHHLIDPRTGLPARGCVSVTVIAPNSTLADAYATALFILGPEKARRFLESNSELEAVFILEREGKLTKVKL